MDNVKKWIVGLLIMLAGMIAGREGNGNEQAGAFVQDKEVTYEEIKVEDIPESVNKSFNEYFVDYDINKAYISSEGSYKLEVSREEIHYILFYTEKGELLKVEQPEEAKQ